MTKKIVFLVKVFKEERFADAFLDHGEMYCRSLGYFKELDGDVVRGDRFEGPAGWYQPAGVSIKLSSKTKEGEEKRLVLDDFSGPIVMQYIEHDDTNVYCMFAAMIPDFNESYSTEDERLRAVEKINAMLKASVKLGEQMLSFGEHAVVIHRICDFMDRVKARSEGYSLSSGLVEYFDPQTFNGSFGRDESVFKKSNIHDYQKEFRLSFQSDQPVGDKTFYLGSLEGIAFKVKTVDIDSFNLTVHA